MCNLENIVDELSTLATPEDLERVRVAAESREGWYSLMAANNRNQNGDDGIVF